MLPTRKPFRPKPNDPPPLTRGAPIVGTDPTLPVAAQTIARPPPPPRTAPAGQIAGASGGTGATDPNSPEYVGDLAALQKQHDEERAAAAHDLAASKAQALQTAAAKSGAAGFGLSGASAALQGDVGSAADRNTVLTMADLRGKQNDENFGELQREIALTQAEEDADTDFNHDGLINGVKVGGKVGDHILGNNPNPDGQPGNDPTNPVDREVTALQQKAGGTGAPGDPYGGIGGYGDSSQQALDTFKKDNVTFTYEKVEGGILNGEQYVIAIGSDGKTYKFKVPGTGLASKRSIQQIKDWFAAYEGGT